MALDGRMGPGNPGTESVPCCDPAAGILGGSKVLARVERLGEELVADLQCLRRVALYSVGLG